MDKLARGWHGKMNLEVDSKEKTMHTNTSVSKRNRLLVPGANTAMS